MMEFNKTLLHTILMIPLNIYRNNCRYIFVMNIPLIVVCMVIMVPVAIVADFIMNFGQGMDE